MHLILTYKHTYNVVLALLTLSVMTNIFFLQIPKLVYRELERSSNTLLSAAKHGVSRESCADFFNIFSPDNIHRSMFAEKANSDGSFSKTGTFGFAHLMDLSPAEMAFLATGSFMERLLFSIMRQDRQFLDELLNLFTETEDNLHCSNLGMEKVRAVTRMLLLPSKSETKLLRRKFATGPGDVPYEALVVSHWDRLSSNIGLLHSSYSFIPKARAPPVRSYLFFFVLFFVLYMKH